MDNFEVVLGSWRFTRTNTACDMGSSPISSTFFFFELMPTHRLVVALQFPVSNTRRHRGASEFMNGRERGLGWMMWRQLKNGRYIRGGVRGGRCAILI